MKVFISWSGVLSNQVAMVISKWIPDVIQGTEVFLSSQNIAKGERNAKSMWDALDGYEFGISVITAQNKNAPWIMFEAGALMKSTSGRVAPILCNLDRLDVASTPLNSFQCSSLKKIEMFKVAESMNEAAGSPLQADQLLRSFEIWWPEFERNIGGIDMAEDAIGGPKLHDENEHFTRLENGITSIMGMIDRLHKDSIIDRDVQNRLLQITNPQPPKSASRSGLTLLGEVFYPKGPSDPDLSALQEALRAQPNYSPAKKDES